MVKMQFLCRQEVINPTRKGVGEVSGLAPLELGPGFPKVNILVCIRCVTSHHHLGQSPHLAPVYRQQLGCLKTNSTRRASSHT